MRLVSLRGIAVCVILSMAMAPGASAGNNTGAVLLRPKQKEKVENVMEVTGKIMSPGFPIVLVRADQPGCLWWAQEWAVSTSPSHFKAAVRFGNDKTPNGSGFHVIVLMVPQAEDAEKFAPGNAFKDLPGNFARSAETFVVLDKPEDPIAAIPDLIQHPATNGPVNRVDSIACLMNEEMKPILLVRSAESNDAWWVQSESQPDKDGVCISSAHFGNDKTPAGTRFRIVAIFPDAAQAAALRPGMSLKELPPGVPRSTEVEVVRKSASEVSQPVADPAAGG